MIDFTRDIGPTRLSDFKIHSPHTQTILKWCDDYKNKKLTTTPIFIINGPHGSGKSTMVKLIIEHIGFDPVYFEPNYHNTHKTEIERLKSILSGGNVLMMIHSKQKAIVFQDVEIGSSGERGFLNDIIQLAQKNIKFKNPLFATTHTSVKNKKLQSFSKNGNLIQLDRISNYDMFRCGNWINQQYNLNIDAHKIQWIANSSQGDLRSLVQNVEMLIRGQKTESSFLSQDGSDNGNEENVDYEENEEMMFKNIKDLELDPIKDLQRFLLPNIDNDFNNAIRLFDNEPNFVPANLYHNSWSIIKNIKFHRKNSKEQYNLYKKILYYFSEWSLLSNKYPNYHSTYHYEYKCILGLYAPMTLIRNYRNKYGFKTYMCKTSNMFSRQSQSNFNIKSMNELSNILAIPTNAFHDYTYIIAQILIQCSDNNLHQQLAQYLVDHDISCVEFDRLIKYNCLYYILEKTLPTKKKNLFKKLIRNTKKTIDKDES